MSGSENPSPVSAPFRILARDGRARVGRYRTAHGEFRTPAFMPVGTQATVKAMTPRALSEVGTEILLANAYHLHLRPGDKLIRDLGGIQRFMGWNGPVLTDSGGFQVFSLAHLRELTDEGVTFRSHIDGQTIALTPERVVAIQESLGVDVMMVLDQCLKYPATREEAADAMQRTHLWARRSLEVKRREEVSCFGIVQGGMFDDLREVSAREITSLRFDGYAIGGLSVGEPDDLRVRMVDRTAAALPDDQIRYLMGVGMPADIVRAVRSGVDLFDCVIPTRSARFGRLFTGRGFINMRNEVHRTDSRPVEEGCDCYTCGAFSRAYLAHLMHAKEILAAELFTLHNLRYYHRLMADIRGAIERRALDEFSETFLYE